MLYITFNYYHECIPHRVNIHHIRCQVYIRAQMVLVKPEVLYMP